MLLCYYYAVIVLLLCYFHAIIIICIKKNCAFSSLQFNFFLSNDVFYNYGIRHNVAKQNQK